MLPIIIILGGTSGTGKSTLSSIIAEQLNIKNVISTDHIRHIMRNFISQQEQPVLFASTYDAWKSVNKLIDLLNFNLYICILIAKLT